MLFLHCPIFHESLSMFPVMFRRKLSHHSCWTGSNAYRRTVQVGRGMYIVMEVRVGLVEAVVSIDNRQVDRAVRR